MQQRRKFGWRVVTEIKRFVGDISGYVSRPSTFADVRGSGNDSSRRPAPDLWLPATSRRRRRRHSRESCHTVTVRAITRFLLACSCQRHCDHSNGGYTATKPNISSHTFLQGCSVHPTQIFASGRVILAHLVSCLRRPGPTAISVQVDSPVVVTQSGGKELFTRLQNARL